VSLLFSTAAYPPVPIQKQVILYGKDIDPAPIESMSEFYAFAEGILYGPAGRATLANRAKARAADIAPTIAEIQAAGATSLRDIAAAVLDARGIPTARGRGEWSAVQVARVLDRCSGPAPGRGCRTGGRPLPWGAAAASETSPIEALPNRPN